MREERIQETRSLASGESRRERWSAPVGRSPSRGDRDGAKILPFIAPQRRRCTLLERLKERKIVQWFIAYLAVAWIALQLMEILADIWSLPVTAQRAISLGLGLGTLPALVLAWYHGELGRQRVCWREAGLVGVLLAGSLAAVWRVCFP